MGGIFHYVSVGAGLAEGVALFQASSEVVKAWLRTPDVIQIEFVDPDRNEPQRDDWVGGPV